MKISPKNWRDFQHYKDRNPPWIRLHKSLLDDYEFHCLPVASKALAPMLWLIASDSTDGLIDASAEKLAFRLRMTVKELDAALKPLIDKGFFIVEQDASKPLAERKQLAVPETEAETETSQRQIPPARRQTQLPDNFTISDRVRDWAKEKGHANLQPHFDAFVSYAKRKGARYVDWDEALMAAIRDNWGKVTATVAPVTVPLNEAAIYKPPPPLTPEERARADEARVRAMQAVRRIQ